MTGNWLKWARRRALLVAPVILLATFIVFGLLELVPGDLAVTLAGEAPSPERIAEIRATETIAGLPSGHFIDGRLVPTAAGRTMDSFDPGRGRPFASFAAGDAEDVQRAVDAARRSFKSWGRSKPAERGDVGTYAGVALHALLRQVFVRRGSVDGYPYPFEGVGHIRQWARRPPGFSSGTI